jgi:SynChlorMet cassette protein ScmC
MANAGLGNTVMGMRADNDSYLLELNNQLLWNLTSTDATAAWLNRFATILQLEAGFKVGQPEIRFVRGVAPGLCRTLGAETDLTITSKLREDGWRPSDLGIARLWSRSDEPHLFYELMDSRPELPDIMSMSQAFHPVYSKALELGGMPLHAALVDLDGKGVLIAGAGGSGKSTTCCRLPAGWKALAEDEALLLRDQGDGYWAHPFPTWKDQLPTGAESKCNLKQRVPVVALFFLDGWDDDRVSEIGSGQAAVKINQSSTQICFIHVDNLESTEQNEWRARIFENACRLAKQVPAYLLRVTAAGRFWEKMETVLTNLSHG